MERPKFQVVSPTELLPERDPEADAAADEKRWLESVRRRKFDRLEDGKFPSRVTDYFRNQEPTSTPAVQAAEKFLGSTSAALVLLGGTGCGKTTAATWVAFRRGGDRPGFVTAAELERRGRYDHEHTAWLFERTLLVLDDLGVEPLDGKGYFRGLLDELINAFYADGRRFVLTTNLDMRPDIAERYGDRLVSRLREVGLVEQCGAVDLRRRP